MNTLSEHSLYLKDRDVYHMAEDNLPVSQKRILHKLVQAIIREGVVNYTWDTKGGAEKIYIQPTLTSMITVPVKHTYLLGQIEIGGAIQLHKGNQVVEIDSPAQFLEEMMKGNGPESGKLEQLGVELNNSVSNDALALTAETLRRKSTDGDNTLIFLQKEQTKDSSFSPLTYLEQWVIEGHTLHPCSRTRIGLSNEEVMMYAPEWGTRVNIIPLAIHKSICKFTKMKDGRNMTELLISDFPFLKEEMRRAITQVHRDEDEYEIIPVHPWQYEHTIKEHYRKELDLGLLIELDSKIPYKPLISFRSLSPNNRTHHHIKTALNVQMTSAKRIVSPASVENGPIISTLLNNISIHDKEIRNKIKFLSEFSGGHYQSEHKGLSINLEKNLSALIRENPEKHLGKEEIAVPGASLINTSPVTGKVLAVELIEERSKSKGVSIDRSAALFIQEYADTLIPGLIHLIVKYGISLEAHLQNAIVIFEKNTPKKLFIRDNGGIRILEERSESFITKGIINNSTNLLTTQSMDLYKMFSHAVLHNHLGEIIVRIVRELNVSEALLWKSVSEVVQRTMEELRNEKELEKHTSLFEQELYSPSTYLKSLIKMRISDSFTENVYVSAPNPLIQAGKENICDTL
ncbi:IucA/IucC family protein [Rossellomorea sp. AcN35-11]|nr:hypothetical protein [Rossellomorea aquimaris]WJV28659.1 IucA/IucC family protein [Rossellomorea sp. AcN35-11]